MLYARLAWTQDVEIRVSASPLRPCRRIPACSRRWGPCLLAVGVVLGGGHARADGRPEDKRACIDASEQAQASRMHGKLRGARDQLLVCARDVCPTLIAHDCGQWLQEVSASMPTVVVSALDAQGHDVGDVRVWVDGVPFLERLDGNAAAIDPGSHVLRFQRGDAPPFEEAVIVREGEKNRLVAVRLPASVAPSPSSLVGEPQETRGTAHSLAMPILAYSLIGVGAVALGLGTYLEITQVNDLSALKSTCGPTATCSQSAVDTIANDRVYAGISLGAGVAAAGVGAFILLMRSSQSNATASGPTAPFRAGAWVDVGPTRGGGVAVVHTSF
jgi:hypothetical protein